MKILTSILLTLLILALPAAITPSQPALASSSAIPTFSIVGVVVDNKVTIQTYNFPAHDSFDVLMGKIGTKGVGGNKVATTHSGKGGSFQATYSIPASLKGLTQIAIRLQSNTGSGYFAYNWFYNKTGAAKPPKPGSGYSGIPTFSITAVKRDQSVSIETSNLPPKDKFDVLMGPMGTKGIGGIKVDTIDSGDGGTKEYTFDIPNALEGSYRIAIRLQSKTGSGYFAYNWFYNNTTGGSGGGSGGGSDSGAGKGYSGYPTFSILSVARNKNVTVQAYNLPPDDTFIVLMGPMGKKGVGGTQVDKFKTGEGGSKKFTFDIPAGLKGSYQIAIRMQSSNSGYFAYNWFYNNTAVDP